MSQNLEAALLRCTDPDDGRPITAAPIDSILDGRAVRIATTAEVLLVAGQDDTEYAPKPLFEPLLSVIEQHNQPPTLWASRESLIAWAGQDYRRPCPECADGMTRSTECADCDGSGYVECNYRHRHECPECKGEGHVDMKCPACDDGVLHKDQAPISIPALSITVDAHLIGGLFDLLPGDSIGVVPGPVPSSGPMLSVAFCGPDWLLIVAGLLWHDATLRELLIGELL